MGDIFHYLELRALGRTKESKFRNSWKAVQYMLEDAAAVPSHNQPCEFSGEPRATFLMDFSPSKLRVASTHGDHTVRVSDVRTGKCTHILTGHPRTPWCLAFSPTSDEILASGCLAGEVRIWDLLGGGSEVLRNPCTGQVITSLAFHPSGQVLAFATMNYIYFWDWSKDTPFAFTQTSQESERVRWLKFDPYGHYLYTGIGNRTSFHRDIVGAEMEVSGGGVDDAGDGLDTEDRRHQQQLNRARYQRLLERFMAFQQDRSRYEGFDIRQLRTPSHENASGTSSNSSRARQGAHRTGAGVVEADHRPAQPDHMMLDQSSGPSEEAGSEASAWSDSRCRRYLYANWPSRSRQRELQPRQRWGRYGPSFFSRAFNSSNVGSACLRDNSNDSTVNHNSEYNRTSLLDNVSFRIRSHLSSSRRRGEDLSPYARANLFPSSSGESSTTSGAAASFSSLSLSQASRSENAASESLDADEFRILPIDQEREGRWNSVRNRSTASRNEHSGRCLNFLQQRDELRALLNRYMNNSGEGGTASSGTSTPVTVGTSVDSQSCISSAASTVSHSGTSTPVTASTSVNSQSWVSSATSTVSHSGTSTPVTVSTTVNFQSCVSSVALTTGHSWASTPDAVSTSMSSQSYTCSAATTVSHSGTSTPASVSTSGNSQCYVSGAASTAGHIETDVRSSSVPVFAETSVENSLFGQQIEETDSCTVDSNIRSDVFQGLSSQQCDHLASTHVENLITAEIPENYIAQAVPTFLSHRVKDNTSLGQEAGHLRSHRLENSNLPINKPMVPCSSGSSVQTDRKQCETISQKINRLINSSQTTLETSDIRIGHCGNSNSSVIPGSSNFSCQRDTARGNQKHLETVHRVPKNFEGKSSSQDTNCKRNMNADKHSCTEAVPSKIFKSEQSNSEQSSDRIRFYDYAQKRTNRNIQVRSSGNVDSSLDSDSLQNVSEDRPRCVNRLLRNFKTSSVQGNLSECSNSHSSLDIANAATSQGCAERIRHPATSERMELLQRSNNAGVQIQEAAQRLMHRTENVRPEAAVSTRSSVNRDTGHVPFSLSQSQALRSTRWGPFDGEEFRHHFSAFHDRLIPRPVSDQTSQTLGAMNLPASNDQGTDVVGLNDIPVSNVETGVIVNSAIGSLPLGQGYTDGRSGASFSCEISDTSTNNHPTIDGASESSTQASRSLSGSETFQRIEDIVAYLAGEYGGALLAARLSDRSTEQRNEDTGNRTSVVDNGARNGSFSDRLLRNMHSESALNNTNRSRGDSLEELEGTESIEHAARNNIADSWNPRMRLPLNVAPADMFSDMSASHDGLNQSAFCSLPTQNLHDSSISSNQSTSSNPVTMSVQQLDRTSESDGASNVSGSSSTDFHFRSMLNANNHERSPRFHPYALHRDRDMLRRRELMASSYLTSRYLSSSEILNRRTAPEADISADHSNAETVVNQNSPLNQQSSDNEDFHPRFPSDSNQPSAFSIFSTANRHSVRYPSSNVSALYRNSPSATLSASRFGPESSVPSSSETPGVVPDSGHGTVAECEERQRSLWEAIRDHNLTTTNSTWRTPNAPLLNQAAVTEYLERRVLELDRRLSNLEQTYSSRLRELQLECQWRRRIQDNPDHFPSRLRGVNIGPLHDSRDATLFPRSESSTLASSSASGTAPGPYRQLLECLRRQDPNPQPTRLSEADLPTSVTIRQASDDGSSEESQGPGSSLGSRRPWHTLRQIHLHPDYSRSIIDDTINRPDEIQRRFMSSHIGGPFTNPEYDLGVPSNILVQTHRIQQWDISKISVPNICDASANIVVRHCKLHNDASCNLSQDGTLLATIVPSQGFSDNNIIALFSLRKQTFAQCLYTKSFGANSISVSISPLNSYILVGLASRRTMFMTSAQMVGQVYRLVKEKAGECSMKHHKDIYHTYDEDRGNHVSVNSARWLPGVGEGLVYGTNRGDLHFFRIGSRKLHEHTALDEREEYMDSRRRATSRNSTATQTTTVSIRRSASTQTLSDDSVTEGRIDDEEQANIVSQ